MGRIYYTRRAVRRWLSGADLAADFRGGLGLGVEQQHPLCAGSQEVKVSHDLYDGAFVTISTSANYWQNLLGQSIGRFGLKQDLLEI